MRIQNEQQSATSMTATLKEKVQNIFQPTGFKLSNFRSDSESREYHPCSFQLNSLTIIYRKAKITPKKTGQFVTFWKRSVIGPIEPFHENDQFDFFIVLVKTETNGGLFIFPKKALLTNGIITAEHREGKRAFRVYSPWDVTNNKQAEKSKKWQLNYFYEISKKMEFARIKDIFN